MQSKNYSVVFRLIHWSITFAVFFILITIFLRLTWMNKNNMAEIAQNYLTKEGISITQDQAFALAKKIRNPMWNWHIYAGYVLAGLFGIRFIIPLFGSMKFQNPLAKNQAGIEKFKNWTYIVFYACIVVTLSTGLLMKFGPEALSEPCEDIHVLSLYYLIPFIVIHLVGVLKAEFTNQKGIVSSVIRGKMDK